MPLGWAEPVRDPGWGQAEEHFERLPEALGRKRRTTATHQPIVPVFLDLVPEAPKRAAVAANGIVVLGAWFAVFMFICRRSLIPT